MLKLWKEIERRKLLEELKEQQWHERINNVKVVEEKTITPRDEMWSYLNDDNRLENPISPLLSTHVSPRMKIKPIHFGKSTCLFSFCKDKSQKKKSISIHIRKRKFGNHMCPLCKKIFLPHFKKAAFHYNYWYNYIQSKTIFWFFLIKKAKQWVRTQDAVNYKVWYICTEPRLGWQRTRRLCFWLFTKIVSFFWKDDEHWNKVKRELCLKPVMRHLSIILYYFYIRLEQLITFKWIIYYYKYI